MAHPEETDSNMEKNRKMGRLWQTYAVIGMAAVCSGLVSAEETVISTDPPPFRAAREPVLKVEIPSLVAQLVAQNVRVKITNLDRDVAMLALKKAEAVFETSLKASAKLDNIDTPNSAEQKASRFNEPEFTEYGRHYTVGVEKLFATGGTLKLDTGISRLNNSVIAHYNQDAEHYVTGSVALNQPLLKGRGETATMAAIKQAEIETHISLQDFRKILMQNIYQALVSYWDLYSAQKIVENQNTSIRIVEQILLDDQERVRTGRGSEADVIATQAALAQRHAAAHLAEQAVWEAMNQLRKYLALLSHEGPQKLEAADAPSKDKPIDHDYDAAVLNGFKWRPEYLTQQETIKKSGISLEYAKNQLLPQLDLQASYTVNGINRTLGTTMDDTLGTRYNSWSTGLTLSFPIEGNQAAKSEKRAAETKIEQALLALKEVEIMITTDIDSALRNVQNTQAQLNELRAAEATMEKLFAVEKIRMREGQSNSRLLLQREESLNLARKASIDSQVNLEKARMKEQLVEGSLLQSFNQELL